MTTTATRTFHKHIQKDKLPSSILAAHYRLVMQRRTMQCDECVNYNCPVSDMPEFVCPNRMVGDV